MISCYCNYGDLTAARSVFNGMEQPDIASWSSMIAGYMNRGNRVNGFLLFREMMKAGGLKPDDLMLVTLLAGCADTGSLRLVGRSIHGYAERNGMEVTMQLGTKLIDMYARCGCLRSAARVFDRMPRRNLVHWTAMICGLANHGHGEEAVVYFDEMMRAGVRPNEITFTGVLNACCHAGLLVRGQEYFSSMIEEFGFQPSIHHYGCIVDLFAKAGRLDDAYAIIENMKVEPNIVVLTSLLAGCKAHKNFEIAEKVIDRALEMEIPDDNGGVYTLISDLYAMGDKWNDVERVRKLIDARNARKNRGSSFVESGELRVHVG